MEQANKRLVKWIEKTKELKIQKFNTTTNTINNKLQTILNFFINRQY